MTSLILVGVPGDPDDVPGKLDDRPDSGGVRCCSLASNLSQL